MNIETLKSLIGWKRPTINPTPTDLEIALARVNADHKSVLIAVKMLTEIAQSNAAANLDMTVVHEERHKDILKNMRELKKDNLKTHDVVSVAEHRMHTIDKSFLAMSDKLNNIDADIHDLRAEIYADREAQARIQNTKLNAIAIRIDALTKILAKDLIKHPKSVTVAPPKPVTKRGRRSGDRNRTPEQRYAYLKHRLQVSRPGGKAQKKWQFLFTEFCNRTGMGV